MIRILTSLVAVLTVTSIQSQTSLSQLSKILSEGRIDELSGTYIDDIFKHSLSLHYNTELYNGGYIITSCDNDIDVVFGKNSFIFLLKNKERDSTTSFAISEKSKLYYRPSTITLFKQNKVTVNSPFFSNKKAESQINVCNNTSSDLHFGYFISEFLDTNNLNPLFQIQDIRFNTIFSILTYNVSTVQRIRSPGFKFFL